MKIGSLCHREVVTVDATGSLTQAAALMREHHVGALVVTSHAADGPHVRGIVTDRDLVIEVLARGIDPAGVGVGEVASRHVASVDEDDDLVVAIATMQSAGVRRLLVTDAERRLVGVVSLDDLTSACAAQIEGLAVVMRSGPQRERAAGPPAVSQRLRVPPMGG